MPSASSDAIFDLWRQLAEFPASETDAALAHLLEWIAKAVGADNVIWIGAVRVLHGAAAQADPFLGWRLRDRVALRPDPEPYRKELAKYFDSEHYGKLTPTYYERSHDAQKEDHVGMDSRATMAGFPVTADCGSFFMIDRFRADPEPRLFNLREATMVGDAVRGVPWLHRRLFLGNGLLMADKLLSPMEGQICRGSSPARRRKNSPPSLGRKSPPCTNT